ncbi:polyamine-modulated factor 1-binding protein 1-like isoform X2 [Oscarella lobularis]|uniref:polyamine-modulated factor 1-binding protein 1-like isoform X2 n=1 Tax=Oscarella lobularis TaxID=121494 RepID=UPI0033136E88
MQPRNSSRQKSRNVLSRIRILGSGEETTQRDTVASARKMRNDALKEADEVLKQGVVSDNDSEEMLTVQKSRVSAAMNGLEGNKRKIMTLLESAGQFFDFDEWQAINDDNFDDALKETQSALNSGSKNLKGMEAAQSLARIGIERFEGFSLSLLEKMFEKIASLREEKSRDAERRAHAAAAKQQKMNELSIQVATLRVERDAECVEKEKVIIERDELIRKLKEKEMAIDELKRNFEQETKKIELEYKEKLAEKDLEAERLQTVVAELDDELRLRKEDIIESHQPSSQVQPDFQHKNHFLTVDYERSMEAESDSSMRRDRGSSSSGEDSLPFIFIPPRAPRIERAPRDDWQRPMPVTQKGRMMRSSSYTPLENSGLNRSPSPLKLTKTFYNTIQPHNSLPTSPFFTVRSIGGNPSASNRPRTVPRRPVSDSNLRQSLPKVRVTINDDNVFLTSPKLETSRGRLHSTLAARIALNRRASATPSLSRRRQSDFKL